MMTKLFLITLSTIMSLSVGELVAYLFLRKIHKSNPEAVIPYIHEFHPILGQVPKPNYGKISNRTGNPIEYYFDEFRSRSSKYTKKGNTDCSVAVIGDSNTVGWATAIDKLWTTLINQSNQKLRVYNFGFAGDGIDQYLLRLQLNGVKVNPQLVIAYLPHFAEKRHMHRYRFGKAKPFFSVNTDDHQSSLTLITSHVKKPIKNRFLQSLPHFLKKFSLVQLTAVSLEKIHLKYQAIISWLEESQTSQKDLNEKAIKLAKKIEIVTKKLGAKFLLISSVRDFCKNFKTNNCDYFTLKSNYHIITKKGENLSHLNTQANLDLASLAIKKIQEAQLLPDKCSNIQ